MKPSVVWQWVWVVTGAALVLLLVFAVGRQVGWNEHSRETRSALYSRKAGTPITIPEAHDCTLLYMGKDEIRMYCKTAGKGEE